MSSRLGRTATALALLALLGVALRLGPRDRFDLLAHFFYALPLPVVAGLLALASAIWLAAGRRGAAGLGSLAALGVLTAFFAGSYLRNPPAAARSARRARIVFWNLGHGSFGWPPMGDWLAANHADLIGLVEAGPINPTQTRFWRERFPGYQVVYGPDETMLLVRGRARHLRLAEFVPGGHLMVASVELGELRLRVLLADLPASPSRSRRDPLAKVLEAAESEPGPTLVMGDFNTPLDSVWFAPYRRRFQHAFATRGEGLVTTWPVPLPVHTLDHVWVSRNLEVIAARHGWSLLSDHRPVMVEIGSP